MQLIKNYKLVTKNLLLSTREVHWWWIVGCEQLMNGENKLLVIDKLGEFEKWLIEVLDFMKLTHHFRGIYKIYYFTYDNMDLETLGTWPIMS